MKLVEDPGLLAQLDGPQGAKPIADPATLAMLDYDVDLSQPIEAVRAQVGKLDGDKRSKALDLWAKHYVANERKEGGVGMAADNTARTLARGSFVGPVLDELSAGTAAVQHAVGLGGAPYDESLAYQRARDKAVDEDYPILSTVGQLAGGIAGGVGAMRQGGRTAAGLLTGGPLATVAPASTLPRQMAQGAGVGATYGAASGFGNAEGGFDQRVEGAKTGAGYGLAAGALLPPAIAGAGWGIDKISEALSPQIARYGTDIQNAVQRYRGQRPASLSAGATNAPNGPMVSGAEAAADQIIANQLVRGGVSPDMLRNRLSQADYDSLYNAGNSRAPQMLAPVDLDPSLQRLAGSAMRQQPEAGTIGTDFIAARQTGIAPQGRRPGAFGVPSREALSRSDPDAPPMGQYERIGDALRRAFRIKDNEYHGHGKTPYVTDEQLIARARNESRPLYTESYASAQGHDLSPTLQPVLAAAREGLIDEPVPVARMLQKAIGYVERALSSEGKRSHLERFDKVKQWMDDQIGAAMKSDDRYYAGRMIELKNNMLGALDPEKHGGGLGHAMAQYRAARAAFESPMKAREVLQLGRDAVKQDSEIGADHFRQLASESDQKLFRLGLYGESVKQMAIKKRTADITQMFETPRMQELLESAIPRSNSRSDVFADRPERFGRFLGNEKRMIETRNQVQGNSKTAERLADDAAFNTMTGIEKTVNDIRNSPTLTGLAMKGVERALDKVFGFRQDTAAFVAHKLFTADPAEIQRTLRQVEQRMGRDRMDQFRRLLGEYQSLAVRAGTVTGGNTTAQHRETR